MPEQREHWLAALWNWFVSRRRARRSDLVLGDEIEEGRTTGRRVRITVQDRTEHLTILGKTGAGKSSLLRFLCEQDIRADRGFAVIDLHGDATPILLQAIATEEQKRGVDLSSKLIVIDPADAEVAVGLNVLEITDSQRRFVEIAEIVEFLKVRWSLDSFGPRTEELLRNSLHVLANAGMTMVDVIPLLTNASLRQRVIAKDPTSEASRYFLDRYDQLSAAMQSVYREAVLNKVSLFASDPHFAHVLGQPRSTIDLATILSQGKWLILNLDRGKLGEQAVTLGGLLLSRLKQEVFRRALPNLYTIYCDELQDLLAYEVGVELLLSEARKYGVSLFVANQFLEQYPRRVRAAVLATGTQMFFRLSSRDAQYVANLFNNGSRLSDRLQSLQRRESIVRLTSGELTHVRIPTLRRYSASAADLYRRCTRRWAKPRQDIIAAITDRYAESGLHKKDSLEGWP